MWFLSNFFPFRWIHDVLHFGMIIKIISSTIKLILPGLKLTFINQNARYHHQILMDVFERVFVLHILYFAAFMIIFIYFLWNQNQTYSSTIKSIFPVLGGITINENPRYHHQTAYGCICMRFVVLSFPFRYVHDVLHACTCSCFLLSKTIHKAQSLYIWIMLGDAPSPFPP